MRKIRKWREPSELLEYRKAGDASYGNLPAAAKSAMQRQLVEEQGYLCAYCTQGIEPTASSMKIEHWVAQSQDPSLELSWDNLLAVCKGNEGHPRADQHCDTRRRNEPLTVTPLRSPESQGVTYNFSTGDIRSDRSVIHRDLTGPLNLNHQTLRKQRKAACSRLLQLLNQRFPDKTVTRTWLQRMKQRYETGRGGRLEPMSPVVIALLSRKLERGPAR